MKLRLIPLVVVIVAIITSLATAVAVGAVPRRSAPKLATLPVVSCTTSFGTDGQAEAWRPQTLPSALPKNLRQQLSYFSNGRLTALGPRGWTCQATVGANGSEDLEVMPVGASGKNDGISITRDDTGHGPGAALVCPYFPKSPAASFFGSEGPACPSLPAGTTTAFVTPDVVEFSERSGARGAVLYPQVGTEQGGGVTVELLRCNLKAKRAALCGTVIEDFVTREFPEVGSSPAG